MNIWARKMSLYYVTVVLLTGILSACGGGASQSTFKSAARDYVEQHKTAFALDLPLTQARSEGNDIVLDISNPSLDYGVLQIMARNGLLERTNGTRFRVHYHITDSAHQYIEHDALNNLKVVLGRLAPAEVTDFTQPTTENGIKISHATVVFKPEYADWLSDADHKTLRNYVAVVSVFSNHGRSPATRPFQQTVSLAAIGAVASALGSGATATDPVDTFWTHLALTSFTYDIPFVSKSSGWQPEDQTGTWKLQAVDGIGSMQTSTLNKLAKTIFDTVATPIPDDSPPSKKAVARALAASDSIPTMQISTPIAGTMGYKDCSAQHSGGDSPYGRTQYDCSAGIIKKLQVLVQAGLITRTVPAAGKVRYKLAKTMIKNFHANGTLTIGRYTVSSIGQLKQDKRFNFGYAVYSAKVSTTPKPYPWAKDYAKTYKPQQMNIRLARAGKNWFVVSSR